MKKIFSFLVIAVLLMTLLSGCGAKGISKDKNITDYEQGMTLADYEGITVTGGVFEDNVDSDYTIELQINNTSQNQYSVMLESSVNGFEAHSYQTLGAVPESECGYYAAIPTTIFKNYGIEKIGQVDFRILILEDEDDDFSSADPLYTSDTFRIRTELYSEMDTEFDKDSYFYDNDGIKAQIKFMEQPTYTLLALAYENEKAGDAQIALKDVVLNGEPMNLEGYERVYNVPVNGKSVKFAFFPLYNFTWDEKTNEVIKHDVENLTLKFDINGKVTDEIIVK